MNLNKCIIIYINTIIIHTVKFLALKYIEHLELYSCITHRVIEKFLNKYKSHVVISYISKDMLFMFLKIFIFPPLWYRSAGPKACWRF